MSGFSTYLGNKIIDYALRGTGTFSTSSAYAELSVEDPTNSGTGATNKTNRVAVTFSAASGKATSNSASATFNVTANGTYAYVAIFDASSSGNCLYTGALSASRAAVSGDTLTFASGQLTVTNT